MKVEIEQPVLKALLTRVKNAVEKRNTIPILQNVLIKAENGKFTATATDLDVEVCSDGIATIISEGAATVSSYQFASIVKDLDSGKIITLSSDGVVLNIKSGRSNIKLSSLPFSDFPRIAGDDYDSSFWTTATEFKRLFGLSSFAMSSEETRYYLNGVYMHSVDGKVRAVATDGHRLSVVDSLIEHGLSGVIVPRKTVGLIIGSIGDEGDVLVKVSETKIQVWHCGTIITSKVIDGTFPDYTRIIPSSHKTEVRVDAASLKRESALVAKVSELKVRAVKVSVSDGSVKLTVQSGLDVGFGEVDASIDGPDVECGFNSKYLADVMSVCNGDEAVLQFNDGNSPVVVRPADDDSALYVVMPMRI